MNFLIYSKKEIFNLFKKIFFPICHKISKLYYKNFENIIFAINSFVSFTIPKRGILNNLF